LGSTKVEAPEVTKEERELQKLQLEIVKRQMAEDELLRPFVLESMRLVETPEGTLRQMTEEEYTATLSPVELANYQNLQLQIERQRKALMGELPLTEALTQQKATEFKSFKEAMARAGNPIEGDEPGSAIAQTTSGIQALKTFNERWGLVEDAERRGELTLGQQTLTQTLGVASDIGQRDWSQQAAFPQRTAGLLTGIGQALQPYQFQRQMEYQANAQNAMNRAGILGGIGNLLGTGLMAGAIYASDPKTKKDIKEQSGKSDDKVLKMIKKGKTYSYRYKGESEATPKRVGLMANNAPGDIATPDKRGIDVGKHLGLLTVATKALAKKVESLEKRRA